MGSNTFGPASFWRRLGAMFYDTLLVGAIIIIAGGILATLVARLLGLPEIPPGSIIAKLMVVVYFLMAFAFFGWFWTHGGQTLGMRAWKIRVETFDGRQLNWQQAFFRYIAAIMSWLFVGVGFLIALFDPDELTWHDRFSRTRLVRI